MRVHRPRPLLQRGGGLLASLLLLVTVAAATGCGEDVGPLGASVGGACASNVDCDSGSRCLTGGDFPEGTCTRNCARHDDCPSGSRCVSKEGGVCLLACELPSDCRGGYTCKGEKNQEIGGESLVCRK